MVRRIWRTPVALILCCAAAAVLDVHAAGSSRKLKQIPVLNGVTEFFDTPTVAGSATGSVQGLASLGFDGTFHAAAGGAGTSGIAFANPVVQAVVESFPNPRIFGNSDGNNYPNRPQVANTAYVAVPYAMPYTTRPSVGYGFTEAQGDLYSQSLGATGLAEFGYNPITNQLSFSSSVQGTNAFNPASLDQTPYIPEQGTSLPSVPAGAGLSGIEQIGTADAQSTIALARAIQSGEAIAYPANVQALSQVPRTCTQMLAYGATLSNYELGSPDGPLPRNDPVNLIPFCLQFFDFSVLDDFTAFLDGFSSADETYYDEYHYSEDGFFPVTVATNSSSDDAPLSDQASLGTAADGSAGNGSSAAAQPRFRSADAAISNVQPGDGSKHKDAVHQLQDAIAKRGGPAVTQFLATDAGKALLDRATNSPAAKLGLGTTGIAADVAARTLAPLARPLANVTQALSNLTNTVVANATNLALKGAVDTLSVSAPALALRANLTRMVATPIAQLGDRLANATDAALKQQDATAAAAQQRAAQPVQAAKPAAGFNIPKVQMLRDATGR